MIETGLAVEAGVALRAEAQARLSFTQGILGLGTRPMPKGAPHVWLAMDPLKAKKFSRRASETGVRITPPSSTHVGDAPVAGVRLCIMAPPARAILVRGLHVLAGILGSDEDVVV
ncbi:MAG: hypothetical protein MO852_06305 [Candidatus Devosia euplotis]|nr:hypothetical protein [Candidatus Devosia euplotis]